MQVPDWYPLFMSSLKPRLSILDFVLKAAEDLAPIVDHCMYNHAAIVPKI